MTARAAVYRLPALLATLLATHMPVALRAAAQQVPVPMRQMAQRVAAGPIKLDLQVDTSSVPIDSNISVRVSMLNADNQPAEWQRPCTVNLEITFPSKRVEHQTVVIPKQQTTAKTSFVASEYGIARLRAVESTSSLSPAGNTVFVVGKPTAPAKPVAKKQSFHISTDEPLGTNESRPVLISASWTPSQPQQPDTASTAASTPAALPPTPPATPQLLLVNSTGKDEILADGKDYARIRVYYMAPNGKGAPSDIHIWMTWSNGKFYPQPLVIPRGGFDTEGKLVSASPVQATIALVSSAPNVPVQGSSTLKLVFAPPIYGFGPVTSDSTLKMSLIDREPLVGCFFDDQGRCIQTDRVRHVNFSSSNPTMHIDPDSFDIKANETTATIFLEPTWRGTAAIAMWAPGLNKQSITVVVSIWLVVTLCLVGGALGGIAAKDTLKGSIWWRIFIGVVAAIVLVWLCVYTVVPKTSSMIAHSLISVFVVGIVGGYSGTKVLDFAAKKLGVV